MKMVFRGCYPAYTKHRLPRSATLFTREPNSLNETTAIMKSGIKDLEPGSSISVPLIPGPGSLYFHRSVSYFKQDQIRVVR